MAISRRDFLQAAGIVGGAALLPQIGCQTKRLKSVVEVGNPLEFYPNRGWEKIYRDQYAYDRRFTWVCSPNCTHECRMHAFERNGVVVRVEQAYDVSRYKDLYGNQATPNWHPRGCNKGFTFHRRLYGPYRLRYPIVRQGWKQWADDGFPYLTPENRTKYKFDARGSDAFLRISWDQAYDYIAKGLVSIARTYSGEAGARRLREQGYEPEMIEAMGGAGTRTCKFRGGMGLLGVIGKYGMYRLSNSLALLDVKVRGVAPDDAKGGRNWSNYTWHGDQAPGHPWVHGLQTSDTDFNELRFSKLIVMSGKNLVENKIADSHFFIECMERGAKIVVIAPEYGPPSTKADYWLPIRPSTDTALFLGITRWLIENKKYDATFVKRFTDFPLLVRTDNLKRLRPQDIFANYRNRDISKGPSYTVQGLKDEQREKIGDFVVWDTVTGKPTAITRDDVGERLADMRVDPALEGTFTVTALDGKPVQVMPLFEMYKVHLRDYDLDTVADITQSPKELIERLAHDIATTRPVAIHQGEGINHWFHATLANRAAYLPLMLTGNIGRPGGNVYTWAGNYKAALFQGSAWSGPGFKGWVAENPFQLNLDATAHGKDIHAHAYAKDEEPAYWNHGDRPLVVNTPRAGRKVFTGKTHMPTPTKAIVCSNVNLLNNAKHAYDMFKNVNPGVELIVSVDIQMTASVEYSDFGLPANSWIEFEGLEITAACSNPFLQIWGGKQNAIPRLYDSVDDVEVLAGVGRALARQVGDPRLADVWKFVNEDKREVYIQRLLDSCTTTAGYTVKDVMDGKYGEPGAALMLFRTYPRIPFWEQIKDSIPFYTDHGRLAAYSDLDEAIEYGENFIVHREGPEATPFLPNVIVTGNPWIRPNDYGVSLTAMHWDDRTVRNVKMPWSQVKKTKNPLWDKGYQFYCLTPKTRHRVHSSWSDTDWLLIWDSNFGDPYRMDRRMPGVGEHQLHINPQAARDLDIEDGDYVYVDANPADRPYRGWSPADPFYRVSRLMLRARYNHAYPYNVIMLKHAPYIATERSVKAHETRADGRALSEGTGYQANLRYGSQQSITRNWHMPMHQTDTLFHKSKVFMGFLFGGEADNHAINTVPKEALVKVVKAEDGGLGGKGIWNPRKTGYSPDTEDDFTQRYLAGELVTVSKG
jgi:nitrate reductase alpha subunit